VVLFVLGALALAFSRTWADPDLWGHVRFGQDLWATGRIVRPDPYSYLTGDRPWVNHEWASEAIFYAVFAAFGPSGLIATKLALCLAFAGLLYRRMIGDGLAALPAGLLLTAFTVLVVPGTTTVRPQVFSYLLFVLLLFLIDAAERGARWPLVVAPALFAVWANLHGVFLLGLGLFLLWAVTHVAVSLRTPRPSDGLRAWTVLASSCAACAATLVNPFGIDLWRSLLTVGDRRLELVEWNPIAIASLNGVAYLVLLAVTVAALLGSRCPVNGPLAVLFACAALLPHIAVRHTPFFALAALFVSGRHVADTFPRWWARRGSADVGRGRFRGAVAGGLAGGALALLSMAAAHLSCIRIDGDEHPARAVQLLRASGASGNVAVFLEWGAYVLWHVGPRLKVSADTRREMVYSDAAYQANLRLVHGAGDWDTVLRAPDTAVALASKRFPTFNLLKLEPDWQLVSEDRISGLFARAGTGLARHLVALDAQIESADGQSGCFP
jgi:hypothetical protein